MNRNSICTLVLIISLLGGCRQNERREVAVAEPAVRTPTSTTLTLSAEQLMSFDWDGRTLGRPAVVDQQLVNGGVEFDIHFPGSPDTAAIVNYTSSGSGGRGALVGLDIGPYKAFALTFTLLSVTGQDKADLPHRVAVGALIGPAGDGRFSAYEPLLLDFSPDHRTGIATTPTGAEKIRLIGIHAHVANPEVWDAKGSVLRLRVEPVPDADILVPPPPIEKRKPRTRSGRTPDFGPSGLSTR